jgi:hypothetical protein
MQKKDVKGMIRPQKRHRCRNSTAHVDVNPFVELRIGRWRFRHVVGKVDLWCGR